jgi:hypothetical protein
MARLHRVRYSLARPARPLIPAIVGAVVYWGDGGVFVRSPARCGR